MPSRPTGSAMLGVADRVGVGASLLCALHCALLPILLALVPATSLGMVGWVDFDQAFVVFATVLGLTTLTLGYRRHRAFHALALLLPGLAMVWLASFTSLHNHSVTHWSLMVAGGALLALGHFVNLQLTHAAARRG
jgi:hypothetical protein